MRSKFALLAFASVVAGCQHTPQDLADRGVASVNVPVVTRTDYAFDISAPGGALASSDSARLDGWFRALGLGYGDSIYIDGSYAESARAEIGRIAGNYGLMVEHGSPVTAGAVPGDMVRVVVVRSAVSVPGCPNWSMPSQPNYNNRTMSNFGCAVNSNLVAMVANPQDLVHGREGSSVSDGFAGAKAIALYRNWILTGVQAGQEQRPLKQVESSTRGSN